MSRNYIKIEQNNSNKDKQQIKQKQKQDDTKKQLRILDYRNGKYQGYIAKDQNDSFYRNGLGILIDDNYTFILSQWKQNNIQGPFFLVYPDQSILYGYINNKKIGQIVCYQVNNEFQMLLSKNSNVLIVDFLKSQSILTLKISKSLLDQHTLSSLLEIMSVEQKNKQLSKQFQLLSQDFYSSLDEKYKTYQKRLSISNIPQHLKNYQAFISKHFQSEKNSHQIIQIVKSKQDYNISFKKCSLTLFIKLTNQTNQIKIIGSMNKFQNDYQFYKKNHLSANIIEQSVKNRQLKKCQYSLLQKNRPKSCQIDLAQFHKRAITHANQFINNNYIYDIKDNLQKINQLIKLYVTYKVAQLQLENTLNLNNSQNKGEKSNNKMPMKNYSLAEVQQQIYGAVNRKNQNSGKKIYPNTNLSGIKQNTHNKSMQNLKKSGNRLQYSQNNTPYLLKKTNYYQDPILQSRLNKSKSNLNISRINSKGISPIKIQGNNSFINKKQPQTSGKKYIYLDEQQDNNKYLLTSKRKTSPVKYQGQNDIRKLTQDFENIKRQIQVNTPKRDKSRLSYYKMDNQVYRNPKTIETSYTLKQKQQNKFTPLSQKKVFRYLPY